MAADIQACQAAGKIVTLSMGGATSGPGFTSDAAAQAFADQVWNLFLGGTSSTRPFGAAVLDGVDLDIEGGSSNGLAALVTRLRSHFAGASKQYYITGAPQASTCLFTLSLPLTSMFFFSAHSRMRTLVRLSTLLASTPSMSSSVSACPVMCVIKLTVLEDNNYCGVNSYGNPNAWDFAQWDSWAQTTSPNKNVKVYLGVPAAPTAANSGYVDASTLSSIAKTLKATYSSFGGVMMWDVSQAYGELFRDMSRSLDIV
jgi:chitinase